jgi:signal transduction histidine kinase
MRANSLRARLFASAAVLTVVILIVTGIFLSAQYRDAVERSFDRRLNLYLATIINDLMTPDNGDEKNRSISLSEPLFELPLSGWYWQVERTDADNAQRRASRSLWDRDFPRLDPVEIQVNESGLRQGYASGPESQNLRVLERPINLGEDGSFVVAVAGDATEVMEETQTFDLVLGGTFAVLTLALLLSTFFQVRFGLAPLRRISDGLAAIRSGKAERLEGEFPAEIAPLSRETNELLEANREIVERARTHAGNLAHALKTPLSVIVNEANASQDRAFAGKVLQQAELMRDQVTRHLERARMAARLTVIVTETDVAPVVEALCRTMEKIHRDAALTIEQNVAPGLRFHGEQQDLEEMLGNLVDNACKWATSRVMIEAAAETGGVRPMLRITVDDDGRGLSAEERDQVARRGQRLDETKPGSGLGLSIVLDLAQLYRGSFTLGNAPTGGLRAELVLPSA